MSELLKPLEQHGSRRHHEGAMCTCASPEEHDALVARVDASFLQDKERARTAPTSQTLRQRALSSLSALNGHARTTV